MPLARLVIYVKDDRRYARRDFLAGVLATGTLSAAAMYFAPGGRPIPSVTLKLVTGEDPTGAHELLISIWNRANPRTTLLREEVTGSTADQRAAMISRATSGNADILNLDIIDIPYFQSKGYITPIELENVDEFLPKTLVASKLGNSESMEFWAAPFNTDVGMLFERSGGDPVSSDNQSLPTISDIIDRFVKDESRQFAGQLQPASSSTKEACAINVLEHALSKDKRILGSENGMPAKELEVWQDALAPLHAAITKKRITLCDSEDETREKFRTQKLSYMRNWPRQYRRLQQLDDPDVKASQIRVRPLPVGILGGQSLALVEKSTQGSRASEFIRFATGVWAQKILASYGLAATQNGAYTDPNLTAFIPHLEEIKGAVEQASMRPIHRNYSNFSDALVTHTQRLFRQGVELPTQFVDALQKALS